jgi:DNA relaxase NicK
MEKPNKTVANGENPSDGKDYNKTDTLLETNFDGDNTNANLKDGSEAERPERLEKALESPEGARGYSNTPHISPKFNTCIDYFKFRFDTSYEDNPGVFEKLFQILCVELDETQPTPGINGYTKKLDMGVGLSIWYGGTITKTTDGKETSVLEMKGSACRDFEDRTFSNRTIINGEPIAFDDSCRMAWIDLIHEVIRIGGTCTRIDLPTDDLSGLMTPEEIKEKITNKQYTTRMRTIELTDSMGNESFSNDFNGESVDGKSLAGIASVRDNKLSGFTATFGNRKCMQLCIYDKKAERKVRGVEIEEPYWVRFEVRYYHENAEAEIPFLLNALENNTVSQHIASCLATAIDFKEEATRDSHHASEKKQWSKWKEFLQGVEKNKPFSKNFHDYSIESNANWLKKEASKALVKVALSLGVNVSQVVLVLALEGANRFDNKDLQAVNQWRRAKDLPKYKSVKEMKDTIYKYAMTLDELPEEVVELFNEKKKVCKC